MLFFLYFHEAFYCSDALYAEGTPRNSNIGYYPTTRHQYTLEITSATSPLSRRWSGFSSRCLPSLSSSYISIFFLPNPQTCFSVSVFRKCNSLQSWKKQILLFCTSATDKIGYDKTVVRPFLGISKNDFLFTKISYSFSDVLRFLGDVVSSFSGAWFGSPPNSWNVHVNTAKVAAFAGNARRIVVFKPRNKHLYPSARTDFFRQSKAPE